jgi:hypothetical protein
MAKKIHELQIVSWNIEVGNDWARGIGTDIMQKSQDIPAGKALYRFEATDMMKAKDILGDRVCVRGNVPISILATGTPDDVRSYCKKLIDYAGRDGGFITDSSAGVTDARPENVKAMFDFTKELWRALSVLLCPVLRLRINALETA